MTIEIKHQFTSAKADGPDSTLLQPSHWNSVHNLLMATARLIGRSTSGAGAAEEISVGSGLTLTGGVLAATAASIPPGTVVDFAGADAPTGWLLCYGQGVGRTTYPLLFAAIGTVWGAGNGSTTFNVPDLRGRVTAGKDNMGGTSTNRLTGTSGGVNGDNLGETGGSQTHTLSLGEMPQHNHSFSATTSTDGVHDHDYTKVSDGDRTAGSSGGGGLANSVETDGTSNDGSHNHTVSGTTASKGSDSAHNNVQPTAIMNKIIFTG